MVNGQQLGNGNDRWSNNWPPDNDDRLNKRRGKVVAPPEMLREDGKRRLREEATSDIEEDEDPSFPTIAYDVELPKFVRRRWWQHTDKTKKEIANEK